MHESSKIMRFSVVIPVYNEEESLPTLIERTSVACASTGLPHEIILVDDGSRDASADIITTATRAEGSHIAAVILNRNYGQHSAIMAGFEESDGDLVITLDADLQNPPEEIPRLVEAAAQGFDVVGTVRANRRDSWWRRLPSWLVNIAVKKSTGVAMTDYGCMLRAYRRQVVNAMLQCHERSTFIPVLANSFARNVTEIDVQHDERVHGESKYTFLRLLNLLFDLLTSMTTAPLRLLSIIGIIIACVGFLFALLLVILRLAYGPSWAGEGLFLLFAVLFTFIGAQFIGLGLLGEYIGRIYHDVRARPRYFVQSVAHPESRKNEKEST